jgi:general secretion pathway protein E/type IV pilus assembly protein PilB
MRLVDMGVEPFLVSSTVEGVMAQRLVRTLCLECRDRYRPVVGELPPDFPVDPLREEGGEIYRAVGCHACRGTGYAGRVGLFELLTVTNEIRRLASERAPSPVVRQAAIRGGLRTLRDDGWQRVVSGQTTIEEVLRVSRAEELPEVLDA